MDEIKIRPVIWIGDSLEQVKSFPEEVRKDIGVGLYDAQKGQKAPGAKPFKGVGSGVFEIVSRFDTDTYRTLYAVQIGKSIYVLHAFQKKSPKGIKTAKKDTDLIKRRYKLAVSKEKEMKG